MKLSKAHSALLLIAACSLMSLQACKTKKIAQKPAPYHSNLPDPPAINKTTTQTPPPPPPAQDNTPPPAPEKPDYNFKNIQFEFNSAILKTDAYEVLDHIASEMKMDKSVQFNLNGNSSQEGTPEYNMNLSVERANAVKTYLVNSGVDGSRMTVKGYGETRPIASNDTEEGKALNRRVEVKVSK